MTLTPILRDLNRYLEKPTPHNLFLLERARDALKCMDEGGKVPRPVPFSHPFKAYDNTIRALNSEWGRKDLVTV